MDNFSLFNARAPKKKLRGRETGTKRDQLNYNDDIMRPRPNIFSYDDYRKYLRDWYHWKKIDNQAYSHRVFAKKAGYKSSNILSLLISGERELPLSAIFRVTRVLGMNEKESQHFECLVKFSREKDPLCKAELLKSVSKKSQNQITKIQSEQFSFLSRWYFSSVRELVSLKDFKEDPNWISEKLYNNISASEAEEALELLLNLNLIKRDESGRLVISDQHIETDEEVPSLIAFQIHYQMLILAIKALKDRRMASHRYLNSITFSLQSKHQDKVNAKIAELRENFISFLSELEDSEKQTGADMISQMVFCLFPLSTNKS